MSSVLSSVWRPIVAVTWGVALFGLFNPCSYASQVIGFLNAFLTCSNSTPFAPFVTGLVVAWFAQLWTGCPSTRSLQVTVFGAALVTIPHWTEAARVEQALNVELVLSSSVPEILGVAVGVTTGVLFWKSKGLVAQVSLLILASIAVLSLFHVGTEVTSTIILAIASLALFFYLGKPKWSDGPADT